VDDPTWFKNIGVKLKTIQIIENTKKEHCKKMCQLFQSTIKERDKKNLNKKKTFPIVTSKSKYVSLVTLKCDTLK
jgi:hypothetical protein